MIRFLTAACMAGLPMLTTSAVVWAAERSSGALMEQVIVTGHKTVLPVSGVGDVSQLLRNEGVDFYSAGGVARLPVIRGLNDDRVRVLVDGAASTAACANHMNPALSYMDASRVRTVEVMAGITPVSVGGDSIAGTIAVSSAIPSYAEPSQPLQVDGNISYFYKSHARNQGYVLDTSLAGEWWNLNYTGSLDEAESYRDGNGDKVLDTLYKSENHALTLGLRGAAQELIFKLGHQDIPFQGFPNQYMDMVGNRSDSANLKYLRELGWARLEARLFWQDVDHEMGFFSEEKTGVMPMRTEGQDIGYSLKLDIPTGEKLNWRIGHEYHRFTLDDWWPAVPDSLMLGPQDYRNINGGKRQRIAFYAEADFEIDHRWSVLGGLRYEVVNTDTGDVQPYNSMAVGGMPMPGMAMVNPDALAAAEFNERDHGRRDDNFDMTLLARYQFSDQARLEFGYARKTRSPNLYERYSWGRSTMAMTMVGWFGDGNGYVGNIDLSPEIAHTLSATLACQGADQSWQWQFTPYMTRVDDYIDAEQTGTFHPRGVTTVTRPLLTFTNQDAELYGVEASVESRLWQSADWGEGRLTGQVAYTRGERVASGDPLYHIMPFNVRIGFEQRIDGWLHGIELTVVDAKDRGDPVRLESDTSGYVLVGVRTGYQWSRVSLNLAVTNLFDRQYDLPLGGVNYAAWKAEGMQGQFGTLPGPGRSLEMGVTARF